MTQVKRGNGWWLTVAIILYTTSTVGLVGGILIGLSDIHENGGLSSGWLIFISLIAGVAIQIIESLGVVYPERIVGVDMKITAVILIIIDAFAIFVFLRGPETIIKITEWEGFASIFGNLISLATKLAISYLGAHGAEMSLREWLHPFDNPKPITQLQNNDPWQSSSS